MARAIKKPEHGGSVRGVGSGITNKQYFGFAKPTPPSQLRAELTGMRTEMEMMRNQQNLLISYLMSGQNQAEAQEKLKQLIACGARGQSGGSIGQGSGQSGSFGTQWLSGAQPTGSFTELLAGGTHQGGQGITSPLLDT